LGLLAGGQWKVVIVITLERLSHIHLKTWHKWHHVTWRPRSSGQRSRSHGNNV